MQIGILDYLEQWIFHLMKMHRWLDNYHAIRLSVPAYHDLTPTDMSYEAVSHRYQKEVKEMSRYRLGVVT